MIVRLYRRLRFGTRVTQVAFEGDECGLLRSGLHGAMAMFAYGNGMYSVPVGERDEEPLYGNRTTEYHTVTTDR